jgi:hypothetical protein
VAMWLRDRAAAYQVRSGDTVVIDRGECHVC